MPQDKPRERIKRVKIDDTENIKISTTDKSKTQLFINWYKTPRLKRAP